MAGATKALRSAGAACAGLVRARKACAAARMGARQGAGHSRAVSARPGRTAPHVWLSRAPLSPFASRAAASTVVAVPARVRGSLGVGTGAGRSRKGPPRRPTAAPSRTVLRVLHAPAGPPRAPHAHARPPRAVGGAVRGAQPRGARARRPRAPAGLRDAGRRDTRAPARPPHTHRDGDKEAGAGAEHGYACALRPSDSRPPVERLVNFSTNIPSRGRGTHLHKAT